MLKPTVHTQKQSLSLQFVFYGFYKFKTYFMYNVISYFCTAFVAFVILFCELTVK